MKQKQLNLPAIATITTIFFTIFATITLTISKTKIVTGNSMGNVFQDKQIIIFPPDSNNKNIKTGEIVVYTPPKHWETPNKPNIKYIAKNDTPVTIKNGTAKIVLPDNKTIQKKCDTKTDRTITSSPNKYYTIGDPKNHNPASSYDSIYHYCYVSETNWEITGENIIMHAPPKKIVTIVLPHKKQ